MTGQVLLTLGRWDEAREVFEPLTERHPDFAPAWAGLAMAEMEQGRLDVAARHVRTARSVAPDDPTVRAAAARLQALRSGG